MSNEMQIKDKLTGQIFTVKASDNATVIITRDGVRVRVYPTFLKLTVKRGEKFDGQSILGGREMVRL